MIIDLTQAGRRVETPPKIPKWEGARRMTIAAAFLCKNGILMCADSEEMIGDYAKTTAGKIIGLQRPGLCVAVAGSGDSDFVAMASQRIIKALSSLNRPRVDSVEKAIEKANRQFVTKVLIPDPEEGSVLRET